MRAFTLSSTLGCRISRAHWKRGKPTAAISLNVCWLLTSGPRLMAKRLMHGWRIREFTSRSSNNSSSSGNDPMMMGETMTDEPWRGAPSKSQRMDELRATLARTQGKPLRERLAGFEDLFDV